MIRYQRVSGITRSQKIEIRPILVQALWVLCGESAASAPEVTDVVMLLPRPRVGVDVRPRVVDHVLQGSRRELHPLVPVAHNGDPARLHR